MRNGLKGSDRMRVDHERMVMTVPTPVITRGKGYRENSRREETG